MVCEPAKESLKREVLLPTVLNGNYPVYQMEKISLKRLETLVTKLVQHTSGSSGKRDRKPAWWPKHLVFRQPITKLKNGTYAIHWGKFLKELVVRCSEFCSASARSTSAPQWRLAPLVGGKRCKTDENNPTGCVQKRKLRSNQKSQAPQFQVKAFVRLHDILKTAVKPQVSKEEFFQGLGLDVNNSVIKPSVNKPLKYNSSRLAQLTQVPFSSDYGRALIDPEKQLLPETHQRKLERVEWFLKDRGSPELNGLEFPVTYAPKNCYEHRYKFPKRQSYQDSDFVNKIDFLLSLCKPMCVQLTRIDKCKRLVVELEKMPINELVPKVKPRIKDIKVMLHRLPTESNQSNWCSPSTSKQVFRRPRKKACLKA